MSPFTSTSLRDSPTARRRAGIALLLIALAAIALQRGATMPYASAIGADGATVVVSPIGLLVRDGTVRECRWWPALGDQSLCAVTAGGEAAMVRVRRAYPLAIIAMWTAVLALFLNVLRLPRSLPSAGVFVTVIASALAAASAWSVANAGTALELLQQASEPQPRSGFFALTGAATVMAVASLLLALARPRVTPELPT